MGSVAAIIVNYGTAELALKAAGSVLEANGSAHVHLVDNASPGEDANRISAALAENGWAGRVTLYAETENHGFGRGNNLVLEMLARQAEPPEHVLFLNPDAVLKPGALERLLDCLESNPKAALVGARILDPELDRAVTAAFRFPSIASEFESAANFGPVSRLLRHHAVPMRADLPTCRVDWVSGAAFLARFDALREVGFFTPDYFLYFEEVDMMRKLSMAGWEIWHCADAEALHLAGVSTGLNGEKARGRKRVPDYWYESWRIFWLRNHGAWASWACGIAKLTGWTLNVVVSRLRGRVPSAPALFFVDFPRHVLAQLPPFKRGKM